MENRHGYRGYVSCRAFGGLRIPVPIQSLVLRDYCARNDLFYKLHVCENLFPHSYLVLEGLLETLDQFEGLLIFSLFMLPERPQRRAKIYERAMQHNAELHFVLEGFVVRQPVDVGAVEEILLIHQTLTHCPTAISGVA
jgi:sporadic carbohydrate cluster protein (TIGR04323 family)